MNSYERFLTINAGVEDKFTKRILQLLDELDIEKLSSVIEKSLHASLKREEGIYHNFSIILSPPESKFNDLLEPYLQTHFCSYFDDVASFETPVDIELLPKIAPAFESTNRKLRIWFNNNNQIDIWGFSTHYFDYFGIEIKSFSPGQLLINIKAQDFPHERYLVSFSGSSQIVSNANLTDLLFDDADKDKFRDVSSRENFIKFGHRGQKRYWFLIDIINKIMSHGHGGILLFINQENSDEVLAESIRSISYRPKDNYRYVERKLISEENEVVYSDKTGKANPSIPWSFKKEADFIAQITAVDGATIINRDFGILAFGAKIKPKGDNEGSEHKLETVWIREPFEGFEEREIKLSGSG
ncbi:MAG: putative sensor domain DACNV-containing protein [Pyrinomonadaceae bacterium]